MKVPFNVLDRQFFLHQQEYESKALEVLRSGWYILGSEVKSFEKEFAAYLGAKYCIGLASGLDALMIAFRALGIGSGDEVIVAANSYIACVMGITMNGATPIFVEPDKYYNIDPKAVEDAVTKKTKAVLAVHLYGQSADMSSLKDICNRHGLYLVEDCAQSHGSKHGEKMSGTIGDIGCFSFYPSKNLGCFGDGGAIVTENPDIEKEIRVLRNYGSEKRYHNKTVGYNSRLDEIQAGLLRVKLRYIDELNKEREEIAKRYLTEIKNEEILLPESMKNSTHIYHLFVIRLKNREKFMKYMEENDIGKMIHYPIPPHLSEAYSYLGYKEGDFPLAEAYSNEVVSIPIYNGMKKEEIDYVIEVINNYK
ncbi:dTDP-4-amino-4,6-dideoxygalactose transaminase [Acetoanaerobium pronyense]|uniref:dTDP-4-amino-4,6-dideoxygalactose transaminase n=1 Tax=Acetoanaerobium pronyense TaxID=1482736 RepID=A0ABS4KKM0_9FIRM|nr:DegT/DnrJ/EryC1/StrS family aminotransferase [Acetoanaerobium pronyense]MBP2028331.1 dTDP-4-amino-4,6-dideoxygalactose transaminase [Acetoanaerobium pronyense]